MQDINKESKSTRQESKPNDNTGINETKYQEEMKFKPDLNDEQIKQLIYYGRTSDGEIILDLNNNKRIDWAFLQMIDFLKTRTLFNSVEVEQTFWERIKAIAQL